MRRTTVDKHGVPQRTPYDDLRRARHGELRLKDEVGLTILFDDYFAHADELERFPSPQAEQVAGQAEEDHESSGEYPRVEAAAPVRNKPRAA